LPTTTQIHLSTSFNWESLYHSRSNLLRWQDVGRERSNHVALVVAAGDVVWHTAALRNTASKLGSTLPDHLCEVTSARNIVCSGIVVQWLLVIPKHHHTLVQLGGSLVPSLGRV